MKFKTVIFSLALCAAFLAAMNIAVILAVAIAAIALYVLMDIFGATKPTRPPDKVHKSGSKYNYIER